MKINNRRERFVRVAENRTNKIINLLQLLGNCSNRSNYDYIQRDVDKIFSAIEEELEKSKRKFSDKSNENRINKFKL